MRKFVLPIVLTLLVFTLGISFFACGVEEEQWKPRAKTPEMFGTDILLRMRASYEARTGGADTFDNVAEYCGMYNGCVAVSVGSAKIAEGQESDIETVAGVEFEYYGESKLLVWRDDVFYTLQEAYDAEFLTVDDLKNIAYYHEHPWRPDPLTPLDDATIMKIKNSYLNVVKLQGKARATVDDMIIAQYCGTYNGNIAVVMQVRGNTLVTEGHVELVGGIEFYYRYPNVLLVWNGENFSRLQAAYDNCLIAAGDLKNIAYYHYVKDTFIF